MTIQQIATLQGVSGNAVRYWIWEGLLPARSQSCSSRRATYKRYLISASDYARFCRERKSQSGKLTLSEIAKLQNVSHSTVWRWVKSGRLHADLVPDRDEIRQIIRVDRKVYNRFLEKAGTE